MAARYWIGGGTNANWNASPTTNWSATSGGVVRVAAPTSTDDVFFDGAGGAGNSNSTISATAACLSLTVSAGYTSTITHNAVLTIAGNWTMHSGFTIAGSSSLIIGATSTITSGGKTWPNTLSFTTATTKTLVGNLVVGGSLTISSTNVISPTTAETIECNGLTIGGFCSGNVEIIVKSGTVSATNTSFRLSNDLTFDGNVTFSGSMLYGVGTITYLSGTITTTSSTLILNATTIFNTSGVTWNNITTTNSLTITIQSSLDLTGTLTCITSTIFDGVAGFTTAILVLSNTVGASITLEESITYTITASLSGYFSRTGAILIFTSSHAATKAILTLSNGASCNCLASFTRIDSSLGRPIRTFTGVITDCENIQLCNDLNTVASAA